MLPELREPLLNVLERIRFCDVIYEESADSVSIISVCDSPVSFLPCRVPNLSSHLLTFYLYVSCSKFNSDGRLRILFKLISGIAEQQIRFTHARVTDQDYFKQMVIVLVLRVLLVKAGCRSSSSSLVITFFH